jgi:hypothetical protein
MVPLLILLCNAKRGPSCLHVGQAVAFLEISSVLLLRQQRGEEIDTAGMRRILTPSNDLSMEMNRQLQKPDKMAEASGGRTHRRYRKITTAGFEDRDDHRTACASAEARIA